MSTTRTENIIRTKLSDTFGFNPPAARSFAERATEKLGAITKIVINVGRSSPRFVMVNGKKDGVNVGVMVRECEDGPLRSTIYINGKRVSAKEFDTRFPKK